MPAPEPLLSPDNNLDAAELHTDPESGGVVAGADEQLFIAGIGASAGGLEALERLFKAMPRDTGAAFVVIQHLSPDFKSLMDELLARHTDLPIRRVENGMPIEANTIYLIPAKKEMIISGRRLFLADKEPGHDLSLPIDHFFRSLAQEAGPRAIGVVLSGTGSDGSRGICDIHEAGGLVISQREDTAKFDGMPKSARDTGIVDCFLTPEEIPHSIVEFIRRPLAGLPCESERGSDADSLVGFDAIFRMLRDEYGLDFSYYKPSTVGRRVERRQSIVRVDDLDSYVARLREDPAELSRLYHDLLIGVTRFFRDRESFDRLEKEVLPELLARPDQSELRVWVAGCATGEEAYSLGMLLQERIELVRRRINIKIFASDVHQESLDIAAAGVYPEESLTEVSPTRLKRFFVRQADGFHVTPELRKIIVFARHNIIKDAPFTRLDLISCRNLLIYLQPPVQKKVLSLFHFGLKAGSILFLGPSESPGELSGEFQPIDEHWKIYRKRRDIRLPPDLRLPLSPSPPLMRSPLTPATAVGFDAAMSFAYDELLDEFMPPGMLVTERRQLAHVFGGAERFLKLRSGRPTTDALELVEGDLKLALAGALQRAMKDDGPVVYTGIRAQTDAGEEQLKVSVRPLKTRQSHMRYLFVALETLGVRAARVEEIPVVDVERASREHVTALESELRHTRESLQAAVEELESSNEELQASNEELLASNEELQSTNEELHSVNEELYTVNAEYQKKITELTELTDDMDNLLQSTDIATVFLDRELCIRKFTPQVARQFNLLPQDLGRRIDSFTHNIRYSGLLEDLNAALTTGARVEKDVQDRNGNWLYLRVLPYRSHSRLDGAVLSLIDISQLKQTEARLAQLAAIIQSSNDAIIGMDLDGRIRNWNDGATQLFGYEADEVVGQSKSVLREEAHRPSWPVDIFERFRRNEDVHEQVETRQRRKDGSVIDVQLSFSPIRNPEGELTGVSVIARDLTAQKVAERGLSERMRLADLRADVGMALVRSDELSAILRTCAESLVQHVDIPLVGIWTLHPDSGLLDLQAHAGLSEHPGRLHVRVPVGVLQVGRIAQRRDREIVTDGITDQQIANPDWARREGLRNFAGFPLIVDDRVVGVLGLYARGDFADNLLRELESVAFDIAQCIERKRSEQALREAEETSREAVVRRDRFLAMLSHELRNPLAAVLNAATLLECDGLESDAVRDACGAIRRQSKQMSRLLDDLLEVSRVTSGRIQIRREVLDIRDVTRAAIEAVQPHLCAHQVHLDVDLPADPVYVNGDPARLQQIQVNLLSNACKYTHDGGRILLSLSAVDGQALISVRDDGIGIPPEMQERIFDLFVQVDGTPGVSKHGMGVGLTLVRALARLHDGDVSVESAGIDAGSTFTVHLPLAPAPGVQPSQPAANADLNGLRLLLVEDNPDIRRMASRLLERAGCLVKTAPDGQQALEILEHYHPDAALLDIGLPGMTGYEVAERIRAEQDGHSPYLVAVTGFGQPEDRRKALASGFDAHLVKPITLSDLTELLSPLVERKA